MSKSIVTRVIAIVLCVVAVAMVISGLVGVSQRQGEGAETILTRMRTHALLNATSEGAVESLVAAAKKAAIAKVREAGGTMAEVREASAKAEEEARANASTELIDYEAIDTAALDGSMLALRAAMADYSAEEVRALDAYEQEMMAKMGEAPVEVPVPVEEGADAPPAADAALGDGGMDGLDLAQPTQRQVDLSGFQPTEEMNRLYAVVEEKVGAVNEGLRVVYPEMDEETLEKFKPMILFTAHQTMDKYESEFDRYAANGGLQGVKSDATLAQLIRYGDDLVVLGCVLLLLALTMLFYKAVSRTLGLPRLIIGGFFIVLCVLAMLNDLSIATLLSNTIVRMGMNSVMVLAMVPAIQCGISLNLGLPLGIIGGLLGGLLCIEYGFSGWWGFLFAIVVGLMISAVLGYLYGLLLNRLKGSEMAVTTYVGYSIVSLMCIGWLVFPFTSLVLRWPLGTGLRTTLSMAPSYRWILNDFLAFDIAGIRIPTGLLLFMALCCFLVWLFTRTKTGIAMQAVGNNPRFAESTGINVNKMRIIGTTISTMLGAVGIIVYSQSYGFMQLYTAPRAMGLLAASAILIGGASTTRARISNVIIGSFLFHGVLTLGMPVANALIPGSTIAETIRILVSNGIILYALTTTGGKSRA